MPYIHHSIRFWLYLFSNIASLVCTIFTLYLLLSDRTLRRAPHNHVIIVLLILGFIFECTDVPWIIHNSRFDVPWSASPDFYLFWVFFDYTLYSLQIGLFAWATMERHILIFHESWLSTRKKRIFVHYLPIVGIIVYYIIYFALVHYVPQCENSFDDFLAGGVFIPCAFNKTFLGVWDLIVHQVIPTFIIVIFCIALLLRVILRKSRMNQPIQWRKYRKMTIQLLSISTIYMVFNAPWALTIFAYQYGLSEDIAIVILTYTGFLFYYVIFLFPFVACFSLPELRSKVKQLLLCGREQRRVGVTSGTLMTAANATRMGARSTVPAVQS